MCSDKTKVEAFQIEIVMIKCLPEMVVETPIGWQLVPSPKVWRASLQTLLLTQGKGFQCIGLLS